VRATATRRRGGGGGGGGGGDAASSIYFSPPFFNFFLSRLGARDRHSPLPLSLIPRSRSRSRAIITDDELDNYLEPNFRPVAQHARARLTRPADIDTVVVKKEKKRKKEKKTRCKRLDKYRTKRRKRRYCWRNPGDAPLCYKKDRNLQCRGQRSHLDCNDKADTHRVYPIISNILYT